MNLFNFMFFWGLVILVYKSYYFLLFLLMLELLVLVIFTKFFSELNFTSEFYFAMIYLIFCVCESSLGLSILVMMIRFYSSDYMLSFNILW
uniref:NADH-ubiquinone oxidoreductase chain 4L n=1 Tax=Cerophytidae sp. BMNH 900085 TaxID=1903808 RepID=A0A343A4J2_9COLE|nr:NADH dehydrogenase subunit 4L [Cerophytidae sp. BMNH 900085]